MLRTDGEWTIYEIQHWVASDHQWVFSSLGHFGHPPVKDRGAKEPSRTATNGFTACGDCWQRTGIEGTFDFNAGLEGLHWMAQKHPGIKWRLVEMTYARKTKEIATMSLEKTT